MKYFSCTAILLFLLLSCYGKGEQHNVNLQQINQDGSNNYRYIFRKEIEKDNLRKLNKEINEFK